MKQKSEQKVTSLGFDWTSRHSAREEAMLRSMPASTPAASPSSTHWLASIFAEMMLKQPLKLYSVPLSACRHSFTIMV